MKSITFKVTLELPAGATVAEAKEYVLTAIQAERGQRHPNEPMHGLDRRSVRVVRA